jgi:hypothetical protein
MERESERIERLEKWAGECWRRSNEKRMVWEAIDWDEKIQGR